jgi:GT2 family glycosyltransferase
MQLLESRQAPDTSQANEQEECLALSIVIVTYNNRHDIDACLCSMQKHSPGAELIVVDNQSPDGTLEYVLERHPNVQAVACPGNDGFGAGVNRGVALARGKYLAIINPDIVVTPGWLEPLLKVLETRPQVGLVTPTILLAGTADRANACGNQPHITGLTFCTGLGQPAPPTTDPPREVSATSGAAFVLTRRVWDEIGEFDEQFFMYLEDTDISWRILRHGYKIMHVPASQVWHDYELTMSSSKMYYLEYNRLLLLRRNFALATLVLLCPALIVTETLIWSYCARKGRSYLRAKWYSYLHLWRDRRRIRTATSACLQPDKTLLRSMNARLAIEQLNGHGAAIMANRGLTVFFAFWRAIALVTVRW